MTRPQFGGIARRNRFPCHLSLLRAALMYDRTIHWLQTFALPQFWRDSSRMRETLCTKKRVT